MGKRAFAAVVAAIGCLVVASPAFSQGTSPASAASKKEDAANAAAAQEGAGRTADVVKVGTLINDVSYSRATVDLPVTRPKGTYALKLLLPMLLVALTALLSLSVHPRYVEARVGIGITALLTLVALQLTSNSSLPEVNYLLLLDKLYILSYAFVVVTLAMIVRHSWIDMEGDIAAARRIDLRSIAVLTGIYFAIAAVVFVESLA